MINNNLINFLDISSKDKPIIESVNKQTIFEQNAFILNYVANTQFTNKYVSYLIDNHENIISWGDSKQSLNNNLFSVSELQKIKTYTKWDEKNIVNSIDTNYIVSFHQKIPSNQLRLYLYYKLLEKIDIYKCMFFKSNISFFYKNNDSLSYGEDTYIKLNFISNGIFDFINTCKDNNSINDIITKLNTTTGQKYDYLKKPYQQLLNCINKIIKTKEVYTHILKKNANTYTFIKSNETKINNNITTCDRNNYVILYKDFIDLLTVIINNFYNLVIHSLLPSNKELTFIKDIITNHKYLYNNHIIDKFANLDYYLVNLTKKKYICGYDTVINLINDKLKQYTATNNVKYYNDAVKTFIKALKYVIDLQILYNEYKLKINISSLDCIIANNDGNTFYINNLNTEINYAYTYNSTNVFELKPDNTTNIDLLYSLIISCPLIKYYENKESLYDHDINNPIHNCKIYYTDINNKALTEILHALNYYLLLKNNNLQLNSVICPTLYKNNNLESLSTWLHNCLDLINTSFFIVTESITKYKTIYANKKELQQYYRLDILPIDKLYKFNIPNALTQTTLDYTTLIKEPLNNRIIDYMKKYNTPNMSKLLENEFFNWNTIIYVKELNNLYIDDKKNIYNKVINKVFRISNNCIPNAFCIGTNKPLEGINNKLTVNLLTNNIPKVPWTSNQLKSLETSVFIGSGRIVDVSSYNIMLLNLKFLIDYMGVTTYILINENYPQLACDIFNAYSFYSDINLIPICTTDFKVTKKESLLKMFKAVFYHKKVKPGKIWIHCGFGAGRTGRVVINYLIYEFFKDIDTIATTDPYYNYKKQAYANFKTVVNMSSFNINNFSITYNGINVNWLRKLYNENYSPNSEYGEPLAPLYSSQLMKSIKYLNEIFDDVKQLENCINTYVNNIGDINLYTLLTLHNCDEIKKNIKANTVDTLLIAHPLRV